MKLITLAGLLCFSFLSCKKTEVNQSAISEASYIITVTGKWAAPNFSVPGGAHFTTFVGMVHNQNSVLWKMDQKASPGTEAVAESGNAGPIIMEIDSIMGVKNAISLIAFTAPGITGVRQANVYCNSNYSFISLISMLGPTPDWFTGISGIDLYAGNKWASDTTINLYTFDAGSEDGDVFGYGNPPTMPQQNVRLLQASEATVLANGSATLAPIATIRFVKR